MVAMATGTYDVVRPPHPEPLLGTELLESRHLGEPQPLGETHGGDVGGLGAEHQRLARQRDVGPLEDGRTRLGGVTASPRARQEQVAQLRLPTLGHDVPGTLGVAPVDGDHADHPSVEVDDEQAGASPRLRRDHPLQLVARLRSPEVRTHLRRGVQLDHDRAVPGLGLTEHEPLGPDRVGWPGVEGPELTHGRRTAQTTLSGSRRFPVGPIWISVSISGHTPQS